MAIYNYLRQFLRDVRAQKLRTVLTVFGIVWGTTAVTLLLAFGEGLHKRVMVTQKGLGDQIVIAWPARTNRPWEGLPRGRPVRVTREDIEMIRRESPSVSRISGEYGRDQRLKVGRNVTVPHTVGANVEFAEMRNLIPQAGGRYINPIDMAQRKRVVFLGDELAGDLFGPEVDAVGRQVLIGGKPFLVVGVMQPKAQDSSYQGRDKDSASIPISTYETMLGDKYVDNFVFQARSPEVTEQAKEEVIQALARKYKFDPDDSEAVPMWDTTEGFKFLDAFFVAFRVFLGVVGGLTLVVGGIGVSNIMNVVVEERTKEIGVKMALGARRRYIIGQFLFETLLITLLGGAAGFIISLGIVSIFPSLGVDQFVGTPRISLGVAAATTGILGVIGFLAGYFPARTAAGLNPVEALRL